MLECHQRETTRRKRSTSSQIYLVSEMAHMCQENTLHLSVDNKNKVEVGIPATSRRTHIKTFHMIKASPDYYDHDFPNRNCKLIPSGYQILCQKTNSSRSLSPPKSIHFTAREQYQLTR